MNIILNHISKKFLYKTALEDICINFQEGNIYALLGENGAGKSTLASILSGLHKPTGGDIFINGNKAEFKNQKEASFAGIICVYQTPLLAEEITIKQNIILGTENKNFKKKITRNELENEIQYLIKEWQPKLNLQKKIYLSNGAERFFTSFISALLKKPEVLILDEPAALLDEKQRYFFYKKLYRSVENNKNKLFPSTVILITHSPIEAAKYADSVIILKKGKIKDILTNFKPQDFELYKEAKSDLTLEKPFYFTENNKKYIEYININARPEKNPALFNVHIKARYGEITLIKGQKSAGLDTLENIITGMETKYSSGLLRYSDGNSFFCLPIEDKRFSPMFLRKKQKAAVICSSRNYRSSNPSLTVEQLLTSMYTGKNTKEFAQMLIQKAEININPEESVSSLSGGMLQKLLLQRELSSDHNLLIMCEPLQGLDSASAPKVCSLLIKEAQKGNAVIILAAADFPEQICSSIYILESGYLIKKNR